MTSNGKTCLRLVCMLCMLLLAGIAQRGIASPTSNEFKRCDDMLDASFHYCMETKANPSPDESACRTRSQEMKDACYRHVYDQYRKPSAAERAEQEKRQRMMREAERRAVPAPPAAP